MNDDPSQMTVDELLSQAPWVGRLARRLVRDAAAADDVVQDAWLAVLRRPPVSGVPVRGWLAGVVRNTAAQSARGNRRRHRREEAAATREADPGLTPAESSSRLESQRLLVDAVAALDEPFRSTVLLRWFDGLSAAQIARRAGIPSATVRWRLMRALDLLRERLDRQSGGDRRRWSLALVPLAGRPAFMASLKVALSGALVGVLAMKVTAKLAAVALVAIVIGIAAWQMGGGGRDAHLGRAPQVAEAGAPREPAGGGTSLPGAPIRAEPFAPRAEAVAGSASHSPPESGRWFEVAGRCIDPDRRPLEGVRVFEAGDPARLSTKTGPDGRFTYRLDDAALIRELGFDVDAALGRFVAEAADRVRVTRSAKVRPNERCELGDFVLARGGSVRGRVVGGTGEPLSSVLITPTLADREPPGAPLFSAGFAKPSDDPPPGEVAPAPARSSALDAWSLPSARSAADGTFVLAGLAAGTIRLEARMPQVESGISEPVAIREGAVAGPVEVVLGPPGAVDMRLEGVVLDVESRPVPEAWIVASFRGASVSSTTATSADSRGRFALRTNERGSWTIAARSEDARFGSVRQEGIDATTRSVELRLPPARFVALRVLDERGEPVGTWSARLLAAGTDANGYRAQDHLGSVSADHAPDGAASLKLPAQVVDVVVEAEGFELGRVGPFDPESLTGEIVCRLRRLPGIRGIVRADGRPLKGARVLAHRVAEGDKTVVYNGFVSWVADNAVASTITGGDGAYLLGLRDEGRYVVEAQASGRAADFTAPFDYRPAAGAVRDLALGRGGVLEGEVRAAPGRDPAGTIIGISQGGPAARSTRAGPDGRYRFEGLTPGPWMVKVLETEINDDSVSILTTSDPAPPPRFACEVREGAVTRYDVDLARAAGSCVLEGRVTVEGLDDASWTAELRVADEDVAFRARAHASPCDRDGRFRIELDEPARGTLHLTAQGREHRILRITQVIEVPAGRSAWEKAIPTGTVEVVREVTERRPLTHVFRGEGGLEIETVLDADAAGRILTTVPAGRGEIRDAHGLASPNPPLAKVDVPARGTATVRVP